MAGKSPISRETINRIINAKDDKEVDAILAEFGKQKGNFYFWWNKFFLSIILFHQGSDKEERATSASSVSSMGSNYGKRGHTKSQACNIL